MSGMNDMTLTTIHQGTTSKKPSFGGGRTMAGQRRYERVAFFCPVDLTVQPNGPTLPGGSFDISLGGVGITTEQLLQRGQTVRVRFHLRNGAAGKIDEEVVGRVAYCRADEDGDRMGIEFLETIRESTCPVLARKLDNL
jgi:c-di-GMP-binding flagellar brake protein YcgR